MIYPQPGNYGKLFPWPLAPLPSPPPTILFPEQKKVGWVLCRATLQVIMISKNLD